MKHIAASRHDPAFPPSRPTKRALDIIVDINLVPVVEYLALCDEKARVGH
jgi:hypothetical protein